MLQGELIFGADPSTHNHSCPQTTLPQCLLFTMAASYSSKVSIPIKAPPTLHPSDHNWHHYFKYHRNTSQRTPIVNTCFQGHITTGTTHGETSLP